MTTKMKTVLKAINRVLIAAGKLLKKIIGKSDE